MRPVVRDVGRVRLVGKVRGRGWGDREMDVDDREELGRVGR